MALSTWSGHDRPGQRVLRLDRDAILRCDGLNLARKLDFTGLGWGAGMRWNAGVVELVCWAEPGRFDGLGWAGTLNWENCSAGLGRDADLALVEH
jgi:hypothetical protein